MSSYLSSIAIHMKYVFLGKLNKSQNRVELRSALGQYLMQFICYGLSAHVLSLLPCYFLVLRKFDSWNPSSDVEPGQLEYYQKQVYNHGTRCWNGPERNVVVSLHFPSPSLVLSCHINVHPTTPTVGVNMWYWERPPYGSRIGKMWIPIYWNNSSPVPTSRWGEEGRWKQGGTLIRDNMYVNSWLTCAAKQGMGSFARAKIYLLCANPSQRCWSLK